MARKAGVRLESQVPFLLFLSLSLAALGTPLLAAEAGAPQLQPLFEAHDEEDGSAASEMPPAQGATPCVGGFAGAYPCRDVDLLSFVPLDELRINPEKPRASDIWGWADPQTGREYALIQISNGTTMVDVTDPTRPVVLGLMRNLQPPAAARDIRVYKDHAFVVSDFIGPHGMQVFDLRRLRKVSSFQILEPDTVYRELESAHNIDINPETGFAYAVGSETCDGGLHMVDVREPRKPRFVGCFSNYKDRATPYIHDTQCAIYRGPDARYRGREVCFASNVSALTLVDVTDKEAPRLVSRNIYKGARYAHQGRLTDDHRYFLMDDEGDEQVEGHNTRTYIWDVSDLESPTMFATYDHPSKATDHNLYIHQGHSYHANYTSGLRIVSLARVSEGLLDEVGYFDIMPEVDEPGFRGAWTAYPYLPSGTILVSGREQGLYLLRRSSLVQPGEPCKSGPQTLCLADRRFRVEVDWSNQYDGSSGRGSVVPAGGRGGGLSGYFTFGDPANIELMVKVLNDGSHWRLYYGQLTDLGVVIRVMDTATGRAYSFGNGPNNCGAIEEIGSSDGHAHAQSAAAPLWLGAQPHAGVRPGAGIDSGGTALTPAYAAAAPGKKASCNGTDCTLSGRYRARVSWRNQFDGSSGAAKATAVSGVTGSFSFTDPANVELLVKALDAGDRTLVIWGAMSDLEYTLEVTDTASGQVKTWHNPPGTYCGGLDEM